MKKINVFMSCLLSALLLGGCAQASSTDALAENDFADTYTESSSEKKPMEGVTLKMAINAEYAPFESVNSDGEIIGFDVDLNSALAEVLGYEYTISDMEFTGLISSIATNRCDYIISALTYSEERDEVADFTDSYFSPVLALVFKKDASYSSMDDFQGLKIGTTFGSVYEQVVEKIDNATLISYDVVNEALPIIGTDELDCVLADTANAISFCEQDDTLTYMVIPLSFTSEIMSDFRIILTEDSEYLDDFNAALETIKENGTYDELVEKWFGEQYAIDLKTAQES